MRKFVCVLFENSEIQSGPGEIGLFQYMLKVMPDSVQHSSGT